MLYLGGLSYVFLAPFIPDVFYIPDRFIFSFNVTTELPDTSVAFALDVHLTIIHLFSFTFGHRYSLLMMLRDLSPAVQYPGSFPSPFSLAHLRPVE